jgi:energy-converting hydrogenase Eha subunit F
MNESETNLPVQTELMDQIVALRHQVFTLLLALVVVSGTLTVVLYRQARLTGRDIDTIKPQATQIIAAFKRDQPGMENFVKQLTAYGVTHPDFQPILKKYGIVATQPAATPVVPAKK